MLSWKFDIQRAEYIRECVHMMMAVAEVVPFVRAVFIILQNTLSHHHQYFGGAIGSNNPENKSVHLPHEPLVEPF